MTFSGEITKVREWRDVDARRFHEEVVPANRPAVLKGLVAHWPAVQAGLRSSEALADYISRFAGEGVTPVIVGHPAIKGRFFYTPDLSSFNFNHQQGRVRDILSAILAETDNPAPPAIAIQNLQVVSGLPGFQTQNPMDLLAPAPAPGIWIGNRATVAAHFDMYENIACVVGGHRRFTLFPPDQLPNLYVGPLELTPAGVPISLVDFDAPDFERYPDFAKALGAAEQAELEPGDAIYIPYLWWHHIKALDSLNVLVSYWWNRTRPGVAPPFDLLLMALISMRDLPPTYREAWLPFFEHWIFRTNGDPVGHMPENRRGALGETNPTLKRSVAQLLMRSLKGE